MNREQWLMSCAEQLRPAFEAAGKPLPALFKVSIGFPSKRALSASHQRIGECWSPSASVDNVHQILISPIIGDGLRAADVLVHELCHAAPGGGEAWPDVPEAGAAPGARREADRHDRLSGADLASQADSGGPGAISTRGAAAGSGAEEADDQDAQGELRIVRLRVSSDREVAHGSRRAHLPGLRGADGAQLTVYTSHATLHIVRGHVARRRPGG